MTEGLTPRMSEEAVIARLVEYALQKRYQIEVPHVIGCAHALSLTTDRAAILAHLWTHRSPLVRFYTSAGQCLGHVLLSWGRGGKYLISDFTGVAILQLIALTDGFDPASSGEVR
jgi:hypothetical protein